MERRCLIIDPSTMVRRVAARIIRELSEDGHGPGQTSRSGWNCREQTSEDRTEVRA